MAQTIRLVMTHQDSTVKFDGTISLPNGSFNDLADAITTQLPGVVPASAKRFEKIALAIEAHLQNLLDSREQASSVATVQANAATRRANTTRTNTTNADS